MKINKLTTALIGLGLVSMAGAAKANTVIYLTGSTAARAIIYNLATSTNLFFTGKATVVAGTSASSSNQIVYEGSVSNITGTVDLSCDFTGSEAGIASVANQNLTQSLPSDPNGAGPYNLPGVGSLAAFYQPNGTGGWNAPASLPSGTFPDLTMADTSQAVSITPNSGSTKLVDYGVVGIVPFTFVKGYESSPDTAYGRVSNITTATFNQALSQGNNLNAYFLTGNPADSTDGIDIVGRNEGSGTRVNGLINAGQYAVGSPVTQYAFNSGYPSSPASANGVLTFGAQNGLATTYAHPYSQAVVELNVGNDGFDSGGGVGECMNADASGLGSIPIGYLGISDAQKAVTNGNGGTAGGGDCIALTFNGVYESDTAVETGQYTYWGQEHVLGQNGQLSTSNAGELAADLAGGIENYISVTAGVATGNFSSNPSGQSLLIPTSLMDVTRSADNGFPTQKN
jgi:hypothetical protein